MKTVKEFIQELSSSKKDELLRHFNDIYECEKLTDHENNIIFLAWLWDNGYVHQDEEGGFPFIDETETGLPFETYEITFEDEDPGGVNLGLTYIYYELNKIIDIIKK